MQESSVPTVSVIAYVLWTAAASFIALAFFRGPPFEAVGIYFAMMATTVQVRGFVNECHRRERAAYELGKDSVSQIHR